MINSFDGFRDDGKQEKILRNVLASSKKNNKKMEEAWQETRGDV